VDIKQVLNANVYIDGTNNLLGKAGTITLPDVKVLTESHRGLGMIGTIEYPTGLDVMTTKIKWSGFYPEALALGGNPFDAHKLQVRASLETFGAGGRSGEVAVVCLLTCSWKTNPLGAFSAGAKQETEDELSTTYLKLTVDKKDILEIDVHNNLWKVNGVDVLANYKANLGG
jgi:uncharacterized protein